MKTKYIMGALAALAIGVFVATAQPAIADPGGAPSHPVMLAQADHPDDIGTVLTASEIGDTSPAAPFTYFTATTIDGKARFGTDFPAPTAKATASSDTIYSGKEARVTVSCGDVAGRGQSFFGVIGTVESGQQQHVRLDC